MATPQFSYNYTPVSAADAQKQIAAQLDPLFNRSIQNVNSQKYQSDVQAGQVAAARGLGHSGLAADQLNKIAIAAQGQIGDLSAQRATQIAQLSNQLMERDKDRGMQARSQAYSEWMGQQNLQRDDRDYNYQVGRDKISDTRYTDEKNYQRGRDTLADTRYNTEWNYQVGRDKVADTRYDKEWNYQVGRDKIADGRYKTEWNYQVGRDKISDKRYTNDRNYQISRDKINDAWRQKEWSQMSPAEKQRAALDYEYAKKKATLNKGGGGGGSKGGSKSSSYQSAQQIVDAAKMKAIREQQAAMSKASPKLNPSAKSGIASQPGSYWYARGYGSKYDPNRMTR